MRAFFKGLMIFIIGYYCGKKSLLLPFKKWLKDQGIEVAIGDPV